MPAIKIEDLFFQYDNGFAALNGVNLQIEKGEIFGFLGPNGAGKSTLFKILVGLLEPTSGRALINGRQIRAEERSVYDTMGFMPDMTDLYDDYTVQEFLYFFGLCHKMSDEQIKNRTEELLARIKLSDKKEQLLCELSKGQKQKVCIIRTMMHNPDVLILDEPASGLDPGSRRLLLSILLEEGSQGKTIIISSHILPELTDLCTSVGFLHQGKLIEQGRIGELIKKYQSPVATYKICIVERLERAQQILSGSDSKDLQGLSRLSEKILLIEFDGDENKVANLLELLVKDGVRITGFERVEKDLETIYGEILNE